MALFLSNLWIAGLGTKDTTRCLARRIISSVRQTAWKKSCKCLSRATNFVFQIEMSLMILFQVTMPSPARAIIRENFKLECSHPTTTHLHADLSVHSCSMNRRTFNPKTRKCRTVIVYNRSIHRNAHKLNFQIVIFLYCNNQCNHATENVPDSSFSFPLTKKHMQSNIFHGWDLCVGSSS